MNETTDVVKGRIENLKRIATRTPNSMITFTVAGTPCKAFGKGAETVVRWIECDPNSAGEFAGHFEKRSEKYGKEFVAVHGKPIETERVDKADRFVMAASGTGAPGAASASVPPAPNETIPAKEPIGFNTDLAAKETSTPLSYTPPARPPLPLDDFVRAEWVTFEDLENQYKSQRAGVKNGKTASTGKASE
jgi:hypothetical protein